MQSVFTNLMITCMFTRR